MLRKLKILPKVFLGLLLILSLAACQNEDNNESESNKELNDMENSIIKLLDDMDAVIAPSNLENASLEESPWIKSRVDVDGLDGPVSLDVVEDYLNAYRYYRGEQLDHEATDLVALVNEENQEVYDSFEDFFQWVRDNGNSKKKIYRDGTTSAYLAYLEKEGEAFVGKELPQLDAQDRYDLALWAQENPQAGDALEENDKTNYQTLLDLYNSNPR